jgi:acetyl esterase/lipase
LNDVIAAYEGMVYFHEHVLACPLEKVIISGDSAGGNFCFALMNYLLASNSKLKMPDMIFSPYPAVSTLRTRF